MWRGQPLSDTSIGLALPSNRDSSKSSHPCRSQASQPGTGIHGKSMYLDVRIICLYGSYMYLTSSIIVKAYVETYFCDCVCVQSVCTTWQACSWGDLAVNELENLSASEPASARRSASNAQNRTPKCEAKFLVL